MRNKVQFVGLFGGGVMVVGGISLDLQWWCRLGDCGCCDR